VYLKDLQAAGRPAATQRSYGMDLLRWFLWVVEMPWDQATRAEARDFSRWIQIADKPVRPGAAGASGVPNPVTGKPGPGRKYASTTRGHSESVLRGFYDFHRDAGSGPMINPFPLIRRAAGPTRTTIRNPMELHRNERSGLYRPRHAQRVPRSVPDEMFSELFAQLGSHRDRALAAFWVSSGARASELLGAHYGDADPGQQLITVIRKGTRAIQPLPASPDAFVWLRLYQAQVHGLVPAGRDDPLWWTLRRPFRQLTYHAAYRMFRRANAAMGANWSPHDLRHSALTHAAENGANTVTLLAFSGHASVVSLARYTRVSPEALARWQTKRDPDRRR
jgi:integrase